MTANPLSSILSLLVAISMLFSGVSGYVSSAFDYSGEMTLTVDGQQANLTLSAAKEAQAALEAMLCLVSPDDETSTAELKDGMITLTSGTEAQTFAADTLLPSEMKNYAALVGYLFQDAQDDLQTLSPYLFDFLMSDSLSVNETKEMSDGTHTIVMKTSLSQLVAKVRTWLVLRASDVQMMSDLAKLKIWSVLPVGQTVTREMMSTLFRQMGASIPMNNFTYDISLTLTISGGSDVQNVRFETEFGMENAECSIVFEANQQSILLDASLWDEYDNKATLNAQVNTSSTTALRPFSVTLRVHEGKTTAQDKLLSLQGRILYHHMDAMLTADTAFNLPQVNIVYDYDGAYQKNQLAVAVIPLSGTPFSATLLWARESYSLCAQYSAGSSEMTQVNVLGHYQFDDKTNVFKNSGTLQVSETSGTQTVLCTDIGYDQMLELGTKDNHYTAAHGIVVQTKVLDKETSEHLVEYHSTHQLTIK